MLIRISLCVLLAGPVVAAAQQTSLPAISKALQSANGTQITIDGAGFGMGLPKVNLAGVNLTVLAASNTAITAAVPIGLAPGSYRITVTNSRTNLFGVFTATVNIAANSVGPAGMQGAPGVAGAAGAAGAAGNRGAAGRAGPVGLNGPAGAPGAVGPSGPNGSAGSVGVAGPSGPTGPAGAVGATGPSGPNGPAGSVGAAGPAGPNGPAGSTGAAGPAGPNGTAGSAGAAGPAGAKGATGPAGPNGPAGVPGPTGTAGPQGVAGPVGPTGSIGPTGGVGPQGPVGQTGATGSTGMSGMLGAAGAQGPTGPQGVTGPTGAQGKAGAGYQIFSANFSFPASSPSDVGAAALGVTQAAPLDNQDGLSGFGVTSPVRPLYFRNNCFVSNLQVTVFGAQGTSAATIGTVSSTATSADAGDTYAQFADVCTVHANNGSPVSCTTGGPVPGSPDAVYVSLVALLDTPSDYANARAMVSFTCN